MPPPSRHPTPAAAKGIQATEPTPLMSNPRASSRYLGSHQAVSDEESGVQKRFYLVGNGDVCANRANGHRQRLAIEITDRDRGTHENGNAPAQHDLSVLKRICRRRGGRAGRRV